MHALGTVEVIGLTAGIEAADVACKTANVDLIGYELAKGGGYVTVKVTGQVGAVNAAIDAAAGAASRITRVVSKLVIPRPSDQLEPLVYSAATVGHTHRIAEPVTNQPETEETAPAPKTTTSRRKES